MIMKRHSRLTSVFGILGAVLFPAGITLALVLPEVSVAATNGRGMTFAGFLTGLGFVLLSYWAFAAIREKRRPGTGAEYEAAQKDERGQLINGKAAQAAFLATAVANIALTLYYLFVVQLRVPGMLTAGVLLVQGGAMMAARWYYGKRM